MSNVLSALAETLGQAGEYPNSQPPSKKSITELVTKDDKFKALTAVAKTLNVQFKTTNSIVRMGKQVGVMMPCSPTNIPSLDNEVLGIGGIPRGRIIELFGPEASGKTTLALHIVAQEQRDTENICAYVDAEHALDLKYAKKLGVNVDELYVSQPDSGEQSLETVEALIDSKAISVIVIDSVAALVPQAELDGEMGDSNMGLHARLMSQACRKLRGKADVNGVTLVFINQIREKIGVMFGSPETTTGGRALKYFSSVRLDIRKRDAIKSGETILGHKMNIKAVKNKVGTPLRETLVDLIYGVGIDTETDFVKFAVRVGAIQQAGAWYSFRGEKLAQGIDNVVAQVKDSQTLRAEIGVEVNNALIAQREADNAA